MARRVNAPPSPPPLPPRGKGGDPLALANKRRNLRKPVFDAIPGGIDRLGDARCIGIMAYIRMIPLKQFTIAGPRLCFCGMAINTQDNPGVVRLPKLVTASAIRALLVLAVAFLPIVASGALFGALGPLSARLLIAPLCARARVPFFTPSPCFLAAAIAAKTRLALTAPISIGVEVKRSAAPLTVLCVFIL